MGRYFSTIPNMQTTVLVQDCRLIDDLNEVAIKNDKLLASIEDGLPEEAYDVLARQLRLVYSFSFRTVASESYQISTKSMGFHHTGADDRKIFLLQRTQHPTAKFLYNSQFTFSDLLKRSIPMKDISRLFNLLRLWCGAQELHLLQLPLEVQASLDILLGSFGFKTDNTDEKQRFLSRKDDHELSPARKFAQQFLQRYERTELPHIEAEIEAFAQAYYMLHEQPPLLSSTTEYFGSKELEAKATQNNAFILTVTRLIILWEFGLRHYRMHQIEGAFQVERYRAGDSA